MMRAVAVPSSGVEFELWVSPHLPALRRPAATYAPAQGAPTPGPDSTATDLRRAVDRLPRRQRETVVLFYYVDLPMAQIAELLGCSLGTVKSSLHDAKQRLSTGLRGYEH